MASELFYLPGRSAISLQGFVVPGATLTFYVSGGSTKTPVYSDSSLSSTLSNPVVANSAGKFVDIYLDDTITYRVVGYDTISGATLFDIDPYYAGSESEASAEIVAAAAQTGTQVTRAEAAATEAEAARDVALAAASDPDSIDRPEFSSIAALLADTLITTGVTGRIWRTGPYSYTEAASGATDHDVTTAGGIKLYCDPTDSGFQVEQFGGGVGKTGAENSTASNAAFTASERLGGVTVNYTDPNGTYDHDRTGSHPYRSSAGYCIEMGEDDIRVNVASGVTVQIADDEQTDSESNGLDLFIADIDNVTSMHIHNDGLMSNNKNGQSAWTGGYAQAAAGGCVVWCKGSQAQGPIKFTGSGKIGNSYSNPINVGADTTHGGSFLSDGMTYINGGEGPEFIGFSDADYINSAYTLDEFYEMAGDGVEPARCERVRIKNATVQVVPGDAKTITAATQANPVALTITGHGLTTGDFVLVRDIVGMTELNERVFTITVSDANTITLDSEDGTSHTAYTSGGTAAQTGKGSGGAIEVFGSDFVHVDGLTVLGWNTIISIDAPGGGLSASVFPECIFENIYAKNLISSQALIFAPDNLRKQVVRNTLIEHSPDCGAYYIEGGTSTDEPIVFENVTFDDCKKGSMVNAERPFIWNGGGNINSSDFGFDIGASANNQTRYLYWSNLSFKGASSGNRINTPSGYTSFSIVGHMMNCVVDTFDDWPGSDADTSYTDFVITDCFPDVFVSASDPEPFAKTLVISGVATFDEVRNPCKNLVLTVINNSGGSRTYQNDSASSYTPLGNTSGSDDTVADQAVRQYKFFPSAQTGFGADAMIQI